MRSAKYTPRAPLSGLVDCLWYWEGAPQTHSKERLLPNGESSIVFNLIDEPMRIYDLPNLTQYKSYGVAVLSGARSNCFAIDAEQQERVIGIQFRPGGAFPFFRMPASEAEGISVDLEDLWPGKAREIRERLIAARSIESMFAALECCLLEQLVRPLESHPAVAYALQQFQRPAHNRTVAAVGERIGLSSRRFIEVFHRRSRSDAESLLPGAPLSACVANHSSKERCRLGTGRTRVRLLRSGAFHS